MTKVARRQMLSPAAPPGWVWVRVAAGTAVVSLFVAAALAIVTRVSSKESNGLSPWLIAFLVLTVVGLVAATAGRWAELRERRAKADSEWRQKVGKLLREAPRNGRLPRLSELSNTSLGATATRYTQAGSDPYVDRPFADQRLHEVLTADLPPFPFVVLHGHSKAGKSRTLYEAVRRVWSDAPVIVPKNGEALVEVAGLDPPLLIDPIPALIWLDDLTAADLEQLTASALDALAQCALVVGTITTRRCNEILRTGSDVAAIARTALLRARRIELAFDRKANRIAGTRS